jgi:hypothetical protein
VGCCGEADAVNLLEACEGSLLLCSRENGLFMLSVLFAI